MTSSPRGNIEPSHRFLFNGGAWLARAFKKAGRPINRILLLCWLALVPISCWAENLQVIVLLKENSTSYLSFARAFSGNLPDRIQSTVIDLPDQFHQTLPQADLIVSVGLKATELAAMQSNVPVLAVMVTQSNYESLPVQPTSGKSAPTISAIFLDQPWDRQFDFLNAALPGQDRIGLLHTSGIQIDLAQLSKDVAKQGRTLVAKPVRSISELFTQLEAVLSGSDLLLAIPDSQIYSSSNIRNILLTSFRHKVPLIGLSQAYVKAGALCAIFSTTEQLADQARATVAVFAETGRLPRPQFPNEFSIEVNTQVAQSMGIKLPPPEVIRSQMNRPKTDQSREWKQ